MKNNSINITFGMGYVFGMIQNDTIPVLLGDSPKAVRKLKQRFNETVHIFGTGCRLSVRILPSVRFHKVFGLNPQILAMYLQNFSANNTDKITVIAASEEYSELLSQTEAYIESCYIILKEENVL